MMLFERFSKHVASFGASFIAVATFTTIMWLYYAGLPMQSQMIQTFRVATAEQMPTALPPSSFRPASLNQRYAEGNRFAVFRLLIPLKPQTTKPQALMVTHWTNSQAFCGSHRLDNLGSVSGPNTRRYKHPAGFKILQNCFNNDEAQIDIYVSNPNINQPKALLMAGYGSIEQIERNLSMRRVLIFDLPIISTGICLLLLILAISWNSQQVLNNAGPSFKLLVLGALVYNIFVIWMIDLIDDEWTLILAFPIGFLMSTLASNFNISWTKGSVRLRHFICWTGGGLAVGSALVLMFLGTEHFHSVNAIQRVWIIGLLIDVFRRAFLHIVYYKRSNAWQGAIFLLTTLILGFDLYTATMEQRSFLMALYPFLIFGSLAAAFSFESARILDHALISNTVLKAEVLRHKSQLEHLYADQKEKLQHTTRLEERQKFVSELHDGLGAQIWSLVARSERGDIAQRQFSQEMRKLLDELKLIITFVDGDQHHLSWEVGKLREFVSNFAKAGNLELSWEIEDVQVDNNLPSNHVIQLFRIIEESITNVVRHAKASRVKVALRHVSETMYELCIEDDGIGLDPNLEKLGQGLKSIRRRAEQLHATAEFLPSEKGGTLVRIAIPSQPIP